jgi:hypothetical protein
MVDGALAMVRSPPCAFSAIVFCDPTVHSYSPRMIDRIRACSKVVILCGLVVGSSCARTPTPRVTSATLPAPITTAGGSPVPSSLSASAPLSLVPANMARPMLVASFVVSSLDHSLETAVTLVRKASPLPMDAAGARELLLAQIGLPSEISRHLDLRAPVAGAAVGGRPGTPPLMAFAMTAKSAPDVAAVLSAAGSVIARRGDALQIQAKTGEKGWFLPVGNVLLIADGEDALTMAGALALEGTSAARDGGKADLSIRVYPDVLARAMGTTVPAELERMLAAIEGPPATTPTGNTGRGVVPRARPSREVAGYLADAASVELALSLDVGRGLGLTVRLVPRMGSKLELLAREVRAATPDPRIGGGNENGGVLIVSAYDKRNLEPIRRMREVLPVASSGDRAPESASRKPSPKASRRAAAAQEAGVAGGGRFLDTLLGGLTGDMSSAFRMRPLFSGELVYLAKPGDAASALQASLVRLDKAAVGAIIAASGIGGDAMAFKVLSAKAESFGKLRGLHVRLTVTAPPNNQKALSKLFGAGAIDILLAVVPGDDSAGQLVVAVGGEAKARMGAMTAASGAPRGATLSDALASVGGRSLFAFVDLRDIIRFALALGQNSRERAVGDSLSAPMPVYGGVTGEATGKQLTVDLIVPPACFAGMGGLLQAALMMRN